MSFSLDAMHAYFLTGETRPVAYRIQQLRRLYDALAAQQDILLDALQADLGKSAFESYETELGLVLSEIRHTIRHLKRWTRPRRVSSQLTQFPAQSTIYSEPVGAVLIIAPWNYPLQLVIAPLIAAIAAGNCAVIKPSEHAPQTAAALQVLLGRVFRADYIDVVPGDAVVTSHLLDLGFDHVFFTGSVTVGKSVMQKAAQTLTPVTLELGGKSPCIVTKSADINLAAKRIVWGKCINAGQTCVAPDYLIVERTVRDALLAAMHRHTTAFYGESMLQSVDYPPIVNQKHFDRLAAYLSDAPVLLGGEQDRTARKIAFTVLDADEATLRKPVMCEEIFGPILPMLTVDSIEEAITIIRRFAKPLALYLFTKDQAVEKKILAAIPFGGGCVNDTIMHLTNPHLPFGGTGASGIGAYHGKAGFDTLSHYKSVLKMPFSMDVPMRYPPYEGKLSVIKKILK